VPVVPRTRYAKSGDVHIAYQLVGDGPFDLVYVPGFISHLEAAWEMPFFAGLASRLASFSRLILFDKRGTGLSDQGPNRPTFDERMDDIRAVMDAAGSDRAALFGVSDGGPMCMLFAATYPDRVSSLTLCGASPCMSFASDWPWAPEPDVIASFLDWVERSWGTGEVLPFFLDGLAPDERQREIVGRFERHAASPGATRAMLSMNFEIDVRAVLPAIRVPTLVLHNRGDPVIPVGAARYTAEHVPDARFVELPGECHLSAKPGAIEDMLDPVEEFLTGATHHHEMDRVLATLVFTDIVGSTQRAAAMGDHDWRELLDEHDRTVRREINRFRGREINTTGDGFLAAFDGPARAIRCAQAITDTAHRAGVEVRAGVHTGECTVRGDDLGGLAVHIGARVAALATPGEVLVSSTVKDLVVGSGITFATRGSHTLKGVPGEWSLYNVTA
jgi:class 3 adenylate cyclase